MLGFCANGIPNPNDYIRTSLKKVRTLRVPLFDSQFTVLNFSLRDNAARKPLHPIRKFAISELKASDHQPVPQVSAKFIDPPANRRFSIFIQSNLPRLLLRQQWPKPLLPQQQPRLRSRSGQSGIDRRLPAGITPSAAAARAAVAKTTSASAAAVEKPIRAISNTADCRPEYTSRLLLRQQWPKPLLPQQQPRLRSRSGQSANQPIAGRGFASRGCCSCCNRG
jgi:hypothetical protein